MGMLIDGRWQEEDRLYENGRYRRPTGGFAQPVAPELSARAVMDPGRYLLIGSASCPWSHRCILTRAILGLDVIIPLHLAHGVRVEGYAANGGEAWQVPGTDQSIHHLHELYTMTDPSYTGRSTVPVLWDSRTCRIVSNESAEIVQFMAGIKSGRDLRLFPGDFAEEQQALQARLHERLNNGVYRAGFAQSQQAYDEAVTDVFSLLDELEVRLGGQPYLMGQELTFADLQLFVSMVRFDAIYYILHRCCRRRLVDYPNLWDWARGIYQMPGIADTVDWQAMCQASFANDTSHNASGLMPVLPEADWWRPTGRGTGK